MLRLVFSFLFLNCINLLTAQIPAQRITDWASPGSNFEFNIAQSISIINYGADPTGVASSDSSLTAAITALDGPGEIFFPAGKYLFTQTIVLPDSIVLRGDTDSLAQLPLARLILSPGNNHGISIQGSEVTTGLSLNYLPSQGQVKIHVAQPQLFSAGDFIRLKSYDDTLLVNDSWALNKTGQILQILLIQGDSLTLNKPLRRSYNSYPPEIYKLSPKRQIHLKCLAIERNDTTSSQTSNMFIETAVDCSIKGIESFYCNYSHIDIRNSSNLTVENSFFKDAHSYGSGGKGYGVMVESTSGDCFIHNNVFSHLRHSMILQSGANGNVFAYNYSLDPYWTGTNLPANSAGDIVLHGNYPYMNLFEGNVIQNIVIDNSHGINGPYNTFFRNRAELYGIFMNNSPASDSQNFIGNQVTNTSPFLGLYSLQGTNHYQYGNMIKGTVMPAGTGEPADTTMFDYSFPAFYPASAPIRNDNWQISTPHIEAEYRSQVENKNAVCGTYIFPTTVPANSKGSTINVFPNPFNSELNIIDSGGKHFRIAILDLAGRILLQTSSNGPTLTLETDFLPSGTYIINIISDPEISNFKLIKQ